MDDEFKVVDDDAELLERLNNRESFNNFAMYSTTLNGFTTDQRFFSAFVGDSFFQDRHSLFESIVVKGGNILSLPSHITRLYKGMEAVKITPPFSEDKASEIIVKLCEFAGQEDGLVKCWVCDGSPAQFYAVFNKATHPKPLVGTNEWTFQKEELSEIGKIGQESVQSIELKLANRLLNQDEDRAWCFTEDENGNKIVKEVTFIGLSEETVTIFNSELLFQALSEDPPEDFSKLFDKPMSVNKGKYVHELENWDIIYIVEADIIPIASFYNKEYIVPSEDLTESLNKIVLSLV